MSDRTPHLTNDASKRVNWQIIDDVFGALTATQRKRKAPVAFEPLTDQQREAARRAFDVVKEEFAKAIDWIRTTMLPEDVD